MHGAQEAFLWTWKFGSGLDKSKFLLIVQFAWRGGSPTGTVVSECEDLGVYCWNQKAFFSVLNYEILSNFQLWKPLSKNIY